MCGRLGGLAERTFVRGGRTSLAGTGYEPSLIRLTEHAGPYARESKKASTDRVLPPLLTQHQHSSISTTMSLPQPVPPSWKVCN